MALGGPPVSPSVVDPGGHPVALEVNKWTLVASIYLPTICKYKLHYLQMLNTGAKPYLYDWTVYIWDNRE